MKANQFPVQDISNLIPQKIPFVMVDSLLMQKSLLILRYEDLQKKILLGVNATVGAHEIAFIRAAASN